MPSLLRFSVSCCAALLRLLCVPPLEAAPPAPRLCCVPAAVSVPRAFAVPLRRLRLRLRLLPLLPSCLPPCFFPAAVLRAACCFLRLLPRPCCRLCSALLPAFVFAVLLSASAFSACLLSCCLPAALLPAVLLLPCRVPLSFVRFRYSPKARRVPALPLLLPSAAPLRCVWYLCTFAPLRVLCRPFSAPLPAVPAPPLLCLPACLH